jgi:exosome complex component RRP4
MEKKTRKTVLPGELIDERKGRKLGTGVYLDGDKVFSKVLGIPRINENEISVIPLAGVYLPKIGDMVIGTVTEVEISGWLTDINSPYVAFLPLAEAVDEFVDVSRIDISKYYDVDDVIFCRISKVTKNKTIQVSMKDRSSRKLHNGTIIKITPSKVPRIIGKGGSMINLIKNKTGCDIIVGQNGVVWLRGENGAKATEAILTIEKKSHIFGLTEKIEKMLGE